MESKSKSDITMRGRIIGCKFCESLKTWKQVKSMDKGHKQEYTVALVIRSWYPSVKSKRHAGRTTDYRRNGIGYKLNYCPECGRPLSRIAKNQKPPGCRYSRGQICHYRDGLSCTRSCVVLEGEEKCPCDD